MSGPVWTRLNWLSTRGLNKAAFQGISLFIQNDTLALLCAAVKDPPAHIPLPFFEAYDAERGHALAGSDSAIAAASVALFALPPGWLVGAFAALGFASPLTCTALVP